ncbi:hypothetical protein [Streptomyces sp. NPDC050504]|uniref:hypothetical protein n=1 Tax=Streptomyces sp. NPDC050504 TaxID=3365618 RepID=UPI0037B12D0C
MYEFELQKIRIAELIREADGERLARRARPGRRVRRTVRVEGEHATEGRVSQLRDLFTHAA